MTYPGQESRIVVGIDGSPESMHALRTAATIAATIHANLEAVSVFHRASVLRLGGGHGLRLRWVPTVAENQLCTEAEKRLTEVVDATSATDRPDRLTPTAGRGLPGRATRPSQ